jgi:cell wall-associated NlpC family hydrolase
MRIEAVIAGLRAELTARHGWTYLEVSADIEPEAQRIVLQGEVAVDRLAARVIEAVQAVAPEWSIDGEGVHPMRGGSWHALRRAVVLLAERPRSAAPRRVATELRAQDGPVQRLGHTDGATVVRGRDGTVGWLDTGETAKEAPLGPELAAPRLLPPHGDDPLALVRAAAPWLGVPYRLGGVTEQGVDCSGLVQRLVLEVLGVLVPRHSSDQLLIAPRPGPGQAPGDLSFVWSNREALCHVGIGTGGTVIHASLSQREVVEDPRDGFLAGARRVMHVPFAELLAFGRRVAGQPSLVAAGFRLGTT